MGRWLKIVKAIIWLWCGTAIPHDCMIEGIRIYINPCIHAGFSIYRLFKLQRAVLVVYNKKMMNTNVDGIILAAGFSSRTGVFKMGLQWSEKKLIQRVIDEMKELCCHEETKTGRRRGQVFYLPHTQHTS
jgi:hypothetical protein